MNLCKFPEVTRREIVIVLLGMPILVTSQQGVKEINSPVWHLWVYKTRPCPSPVLTKVHSTCTSSCNHVSLGLWMSLSLKNWSSQYLGPGEKQAQLVSIRSTKTLTKNASLYSWIWTLYHAKLKKNNLIYVLHSFFYTS